VQLRKAWNSDSDAARPSSRRGEGGSTGPSQLKIKKKSRKKEKKISSDLWEEMWVQAEKSEIAQYYQCMMADELRYPTGSVMASSSQPSVSHSSKAASSRPAITAGMNCLRLMQCDS